MSEQIASPATVGVTGSSGLVGSALIRRLSAEGRRVIPLRRSEKGSELFSGLAINSSDPFMSVVHLAGEPIASGRWTTAKMARIRQSRVEGTRSLCQSLARLKTPPPALVCASAIGFYGDRGNEPLDETSSPGRGFLAEVVQAWEEATQPAIDCGIRVVLLRFGMILSANGGALAKMLTPFRYGLGGRVGSGQQYWSWVSLDDAVGIICHALANDKLSGPVNAVAPQAVTNAEFTAALGRALGPPTIFPVPALAARLAFGQMADELLLASARVVPRRLMESGYAFQHTGLDTALASLLNPEQTSRV